MSGEQVRSKGAALFYVVAVAATGVSIDTSWRFFGERLHIPNTIGGQPPLFGVLGERAALFGVLELTLLACGVAMRANARRPNGKPGATQILAWVLCGLSAYMAVDLAGAVEGFARVALGPVLGLVALHLALGIEVKVRRGASSGVWARIAAEVRERVLSRIGLGDDERKAAERSRDRARDRAARLATATGWVPRKKVRLERAIRASGATLDPKQRARLREQVIVLKSINSLADVDGADSPWADVVPEYVQRIADDAHRDAEAVRAAAERHAQAVIAEAQATADALRGEAREALREAQHRSASAVAEAEAARSTVRSEAEAIRAAADEFRRDREAAAQQQYEQLTAAARAEAAAIRNGAQADAGALRDAVARNAAKHPEPASPARREAPSEALRTVSDEALREALGKHFGDELPSIRAAEQHLRGAGVRCSTSRVQEAIAAMRTTRERVNGHSHNLAMP